MKRYRAAEFFDSFFIGMACGLMGPVIGWKLAIAIDLIALAMKPQRWNETE